MTAKLLHISPKSRTACKPRAVDFDPGPPIPWPLAPLIALGMVAAMMPWLPAALLMHINRPE